MELKMKMQTTSRFLWGAAIGILSAAVVWELHRREEVRIDQILTARVKAFGAAIERDIAAGKIEREENQREAQENFDTIVQSVNRIRGLVNPMREAN